MRYIFDRTLEVLISIVSGTLMPFDSFPILNTFRTSDQPIKMTSSWRRQKHFTILYLRELQDRRKDF